jgi:NitT/TauT family transport system substrate-binding protein
VSDHSFRRSVRRPSLVFGLALSAILTTLAPVAAAPPAPATIRVAAPPTYDVAPFVYAMQSGAFAKAGLTIDFTAMATGGAVSQAVAGGAIDIGFASLNALIAGHARGIPFQILSPGGAYDGSNAGTVMVVRKDATFATGQDLTGKTIGALTLKDMDALATAGWVDTHGGDSRTLRFVELPNPAMLPALLDGRIDGFTLGEPWVTQALDSGRVRVFAKPLDVIGAHFITSGWFATSGTIDANRDAVIRFEHVLLDATKYANTHEPEMASLMATYTKIDRAVVSQTMRSDLPTTLDARLVQPLIDICARYHVISERFDARDLISPTALAARAAAPG